MSGGALKRGAVHRGLQAILESIVRGQVRAYLHAHPEVGGAAPELIESGIAKRIIGEVCGAGTVARLREELALGPGPAETPGARGGAEMALLRARLKT